MSLVLYFLSWSVMVCNVTFCHVTLCHEVVLCWVILYYLVVFCFVEPLSLSFPGHFVMFGEFCWVVCV